MDFSNATLPSPLPLEKSFSENEVEEGLKQIFLQVFKDHLAEGLFDISVLGAAHLGSFELVRRAVNADGLVLLPGEKEEESTRYLLKAWKSGNVQGRGLHFLRTYLQLTYPNIGEVIQLWHGKNTPYPSDLREEKSDDAFLTSRIRIKVVGFPNAATDRRLLDCIVQITPARLVPELRYVGKSRLQTISPANVGSVTQQLSSSGSLETTFSINSTSYISFISMGESRTSHLISKGHVNV